MGGGSNQEVDDITVNFNLKGELMKLSEEDRVKYTKEKKLGIKAILAPRTIQTVTGGSVDSLHSSIREKIFQCSGIDCFPPENKIKQ